MSTLRLPKRSFALKRGINGVPFQKGVVATGRSLGNINAADYKKGVPKKKVTGTEKNATPFQRQKIHQKGSTSRVGE